ncbi:Metalloreductase STEAP4 [Seminavis robusta]|uniref:Metalloreductase STEAP4 n=1 Tax=Seminavis robusta TaxID=568900 RepID=A0A9N8HUZ9_9STRA|nr:Metalloreductase STEAP4 [Seminavis robusta]|eukprot:Sro1841_g300950.1 Metalloreductase STEAP4 (472) ;mRNA; r:2200-3763
MLHCAIVGTGDMAYGLAHLYSNNNKFMLNTLEVTKPGLEMKEKRTFHDTGVSLGSFKEAIDRADIVILAIPAEALKGFVANYFQFLRSKILVDVTNSSVRGEDLSSMCRLTEVEWVKAFNDIGAVDILLNKPYSKTRVATTMCSPHKKALGLVQYFAEESFGMTVKNVPPERYNDIAMHQNSLGQEWIHAAWVMMILFAICEFYAILRYNVFKGYAWFHLPIQVSNKGICWTALNGFAWAQLPGLVARMFNVSHSDSLSDKPRWLLWSLSIRKHVGILSLWFLFIHILMSLLLLNPAYYGKFYLHPKANTSKMNSIGEASFFFAILGTGFYVILGICSLPSVGSHMTNKQWQLVYGPLAWVALAYGTIHVMVMGVKGWDDQEKWPGGLPPITLTSVLVPLLVMWLKLVQVLVTVMKRSMHTEKPHQNSYDMIAFAYQGDEETTPFHDEEKSMLPLKRGSDTESPTQREVVW